MANNRAVIECLQCDKRITFLKYYPSMGWAPVYCELGILNAFLARHDHSEGTSLGGNPYRLVYDHTIDERRIEDESPTNSK